jgi:hypothetical protein
MPTIADRIARAATGAIALLGLSAQPAAARTITPAQAPRAWVIYAEAATKTITGWVNDADAPAPKLRAALIGDTAKTGQAPPPLVVKIWVDQGGALTRAETVASASPDITQDLEALLVGRHLPPPPKHMRQPMRLALQVLPDPDARPVATTSDISPAQ